MSNFVNLSLASPMLIVTLAALWITNRALQRRELRLALAAIPTRTGHPQRRVELAPPPEGSSPLPRPRPLPDAARSHPAFGSSIRHEAA